MHVFFMFLQSFIDVLIIGILFGAGLPILFALGIRTLSASENADGTVNPAKRAAAYVIFALVVVAIIAGIAIIVLSGLTGKGH